MDENKALTLEANREAKSTSSAGQSPQLPDPESLDLPKTEDFSQVTNEQFIRSIFKEIPVGTSPAVCSKPGDPNESKWFAQRPELADLPATKNNYFTCSVFRHQEDGSFKVRKPEFAGCYGIMLDDIGAKMPLNCLGDFKSSWMIETSPGNFQIGFIFKEPITDGEIVEKLSRALIAKGLTDPGASGPLTRWGRLPKAINGKEKHIDAEGKPFCCLLKEWRPELRYTLQEIIEGLNLVLEPKKEPAKQLTTDGAVTVQNIENPVLAALKARGLYKKDLGSGKHDITCPWVSEHTDVLDNGSAYMEPSEGYPYGGFRCHHSHGDKKHIADLLEHLDIPTTEAANKPVIRVVPGELERVVDSAERALADSGKYYQAGGLIVSISTNVATGDSSILPLGVSELTRQLSVLAIWEAPNRSGSFVRCDPSSKHVKIVNESRTFKYLLPLIGIARQPYFRESDHELIKQPGYDKESKFFGVFDPGQYPIPAEPTMEEARSALALLEDLLAEFHFVSAVDKAAALSAIFTAVVRPTLPLAPGYHVKAPVFGSGKSYLCEIIGAFAGPGGNAKVSYPKTSEEATKVILSLLLSNPAVIEFDDMDTDWLPHGVLLRMLTAEYITDRILGYSKTATVCTRTLLLGSGNNVGPVRDLLRRVLAINLDPRCSTPSTITYNGSPLDKVRQNRGQYVAAVLTIISAWRRCGSLQSDVESIASFGGGWTEYCRKPLIWLGHPDPASTLISQVSHDPDSDALGRLMSQWFKAFGSKQTTVRKAIDEADRNEDLMEAMKEFPIEDRGAINASKLGWLLKKNANRIVNGHEFQRVDAPERLAWQVVPVSKGDNK